MHLGTVLHKMAIVPSTNDVARDLARQGAPHGTVVLADEQTEGRGTKGRRWHSPPGVGLYASFVLRFPEGDPVPAFRLLPLAAGVAAADAVLAASGIEVKLKWPNDLVRDGRKIGGILVESVSAGSSPDFAIVGVGINVGHEEKDFPAELRSRSTSLRLAGGRTVNGNALFEALCRALDNCYNVLIRGDAKAIVRAFEDRAAFSPGDAVRVTTVAGTFRGVYRGLDEDGRLIVGRRRGAERVAFDDIRALERR